MASLNKHEKEKFYLIATYLIRGCRYNKHCCASIYRLTPGIIRKSFNVIILQMKENKLKS